MKRPIYRTVTSWNITCCLCTVVTCTVLATTHCNYTYIYILNHRRKVSKATMLDCFQGKIKKTSKKQFLPWNVKPGSSKYLNMMVALHVIACTSGDSFQISCWTSIVCMTRFLKSSQEQFALGDLMEQRLLQVYVPNLQLELIHVISSIISGCCLLISPIWSNDVWVSLYLRRWISSKLIQTPMTIRRTYMQAHVLLGTCPTTPQSLCVLMQHAKAL